MSIFKPTFDKYSSARFVAPADEYEIEVTSIRPRQLEIKKGDRAGQKMNMLTVNSKIISGSSSGKELVDKVISLDFIVNTDQEDGFNRVLRFAANCLGINAGGVNAEQYDAEFIQRFGDKDWSVDFESGTVGDGWSQLVKTRVIVQTKVGGTTEYPNVQLAGSRPF